MPPNNPPELVILFDGVCNLCEGSVRFIILRDPHRRFRFAPIQSDAGHRLLDDFEMDVDMKTFYLVRGEQLLEKSDAWLEIVRHLSGAWPLLYAFKVVPGFIRDVVYDFIGRNRYRWFGRKEACMVPTPEIRERFLE